MILNRQRRIRIPIKRLGSFLARAQKTLHLSSNSLTVCLVTNSQIAHWNRSYRGKPKPTDVLSFPAEAAPRPRPRISHKDISSYLGDIAIAPAVARRNARRFRRSFDDEMRILILHGILHLMGYDHETDAGQMDRRERSLRRTLGLA